MRISPRTAISSLFTNSRVFILKILYADVWIILFTHFYLIYGISKSHFSLLTCLHHLKR